MTKELFNKERYNKISIRTYWKISAGRYQKEQGLEDIFMGEEEFTRLEHIVTSRENVLAAIQDLANHGLISSPIKMDKRRDYFEAKDTLTVSGILTNSRAPRLSDKGRAFLFEYGRRKYESDG